MALQFSTIGFINFNKEYNIWEERLNTAKHGN